jgi:hypothetical protein
MPEIPPPERFRPRPLTWTMPAGTWLWRAYPDRHRLFLFNQKPKDPQFGAGRFSGMPPDSYGYLYAGLDPATALLEKYLRDVPYDDRGHRVLRRHLLRGERLAPLEVDADLVLVDLRDQTGLAAVCQDHWLLHAEGHDHAKTRRWASWIRAAAPRAHGFAWPAKRRIGGTAVVLFGDRCPVSHLQPADEPLDLAADDTVDRLNMILAPYRTTVRRSPRR